ncbi:MAG TPA: poly-beta-1,6 N-acetyl-D-glucosamine export porin PgaA [Candidatus Polarisedimenticolaceae bacterium]|nr:poly-beta-1,6 N-acetyl-D-glucosamine export porin PgaA [Candidatus Polarisedimenticolaceae bacterium]
MLTYPPTTRGDDPQAERGSLRERREEAVELARSGQYERALESFERLRAEYPEEPSVLYDQTVVLFWAGRHTDALGNAPWIDPRLAPAYVISAVAGSARNTQQFAMAVEWYGHALAADPDSVDARVGLAMSLADAGEPRRARQTLEAVEPAARQTARVRLSSAYLYTRDGAQLEAIGEYDAVLEVDPDNFEALRGKAQALRALLLPRQALELARQHPGILDEREIARTEGDALALDLRDAVESAGEGPPYARIDEAIAAIDRRLATEPSTGELARRLRYDRIVGLVAAGRPQPAVADYESLIAEGAEPPTYALIAAGSAYLALRRPREAERALRRGEAIDPGNVALRIELFYALIALERFGEAFRVIDGLSAELEPAPRAPGSPVGQPNPVQLDVEIIAAVGRAYADQLAEAQRRLEHLLARAPNNAQARYELGNVYRWRGFHRRAERQYVQVGDHGGVGDVWRDVAAAHNDLDLGRPASTGRTLSRLGVEQPATLAVRDLERRWAAHNRSRLSIDARYGNSSGEVFGSEQYQIDGWWFSPPLGHEYRIYVRTFDSWARFDDGETARRRLAAGVEYGRGGLRAAGEINGDRFDFDSPGAAARLDWSITDHWLFGCVAEYDSYATQLRADRAGIDSNLFSARGTYRGSESWYVSLALGHQPYDDGNRMTAVAADGRLRLYNGYKYKVDGFALVESSTGSDADVPYFSPERALVARIGIANDWRQWRVYDRSLTHRLSADAGLYDQRGFGADPIWTLDYRLQWNLNARWQLWFGAQRNRRVYDGSREDATFWTFGVDGRP